MHLFSLLRKFSNNWREMALVVTSVLFGYILLEAVYRWYQYVTLPDRLFTVVSANIPTERNSTDVNRRTYKYDQYTGYLYQPNNEGRRGDPWNSSWKTNSHGHVSRSEYPVKKPVSEFRIAIIGDSFTANITNNVLWTDILQERLNASPEWRVKTGNKFTRVLNFGVDGFGMVQFAAMARHHIRKFSPDFVIVNFISDDILRRIRYPEPFVVSDVGENRERLIREYVQKNYLDRIDWFRFYPELIAATAGKYLGLKTALPIDAKALYAGEGKSHYSIQEGLEASASAVRDIIALKFPTVFLEAPLYYDLVNEFQSSPHLKGLTEKLRTRVPEANIVSMTPAMSKLLDGKRMADRPDLRGMSLHQIVALPENRKLEVYRWFFLPLDLHYTDYGTTLYGQQVASYLIESLTLEIK